MPTFFHVVLILGSLNYMTYTWAPHLYFHNLMVCIHRLILGRNNGDAHFAYIGLGTLLLYLIEGPAECVPLAELVGFFQDQLLDIVDTTF